MEPTATIKGSWVPPETWLGVLLSKQGCAAAGVEMWISPFLAVYSQTLQLHGFTTQTPEVTAPTHNSLVPL